MAGSNVNIAPEHSEIEVSLFGPGYGESVVLHLGENLWLIVDSCLDPLTGDPAPLTYLHHLHIDLATAVRWVVATHWHDDHIRGLGRIMHVCESAELCAPQPSNTNNGQLCELVPWGKPGLTSSTSLVHKRPHLKRCGFASDHNTTPPSEMQLHSTAILCPPQRTCASPPSCRHAPPGRFYVTFPGAQ